MSADPHASHGTAVATHAPTHGHDAHGHDAHGHDTGHGAAGGHGHDESPRQTPVGPWEATPWGMIILGLLLTGAVVAVAVSGNWASKIDQRPGSTLGAPGFPAK